MDWVDFNQISSTMEKIEKIDNLNIGSKLIHVVAYG